MYQKTKNKKKKKKKTSNYINIVSIYFYFKRTITDYDESKSKLSKIIDVSNLKFRERDDLEFVFKFWRSPKNNYEILKYWDYRLRAYYKRRYDYIENMCDWDYQMKLKPRVNRI